MNRVLFVIPSLYGGGAERVASVMAGELANREGFSVSILTFFPSAKEYAVDEKVKRFYLTEDREAYERSSRFERAIALRRAISICNPDVVIPFLWYTGVYVVLSTFGMRMKIVQTVRNDPASVPNNPIKRGVRNFACLLSWKVMCQTGSQRDYFSSWVKRKTAVIPNPVSQGFIEKRVREGDVFEVTMAGRLEEQKNYEMALDAASELKNRGVEFHFSIYGEGSLRKQISHAISDRALDGYVDLCGRTDNLADKMAASNAFVLTSKREGMPNSLMEAMAVGLPCISTNCPTGPSDLIKDGENGYLVAVDDVGCLVDRLEKLARDRNLRRVLGDEAKKTVKREFATNCVIDRLVKTLDVD